VESWSADGSAREDRLPAERSAGRTVRRVTQHAARGVALAGKFRTAALQKGATGGAFVARARANAIITGLRDMFHLGAIQPEHLTEARVMIESIAVRDACERATVKTSTRLNAKYCLGGTQTRAENKYRLLRPGDIHLEFHRILARATKNPVMVIVMEALIDVMQHFIHAIGQKQNPWVIPSRRDS